MTKNIFTPNSYTEFTRDGHLGIAMQKDSDPKPSESKMLI